MTVKQLLGLRIKELRTKIKLTQAQLTEKVGIDPKHQSCIENGKNFPSADLLDKYAIVFGIETCELFEISHNKSKEQLKKYLINVINNCNEFDLRIIYRIVNSIIK